MPRNVDRESSMSPALLKVSRQSEKRPERKTVFASGPD